MGIFRYDGMLFVQLQGADKSFFQFRKEMQGTAQKSHMTADRFPAGQAADGLVYNCLKNRGSQILFGGAFINQGLNV